MTYTILKRIKHISELDGYQLKQDDSNRILNLQKKEVLRLAYNNQISNAKYNKRSKGISGVGCDLRKLPNISLTEALMAKSETENKQESNKEEDIKLQKIIDLYHNKAMLVFGDPIFSFEIKDSKIYITRYHDREYRTEVTIPSFVYGFQTHIIKDDKWDYTAGAFFQCKYIKKVTGTSPIHGSLAYLFYEFDGDKLELVDFDTSNVTNMDNTFCSCGINHFKELKLGNRFDTHSVTSMRHMFDSCGSNKLERLDLGNKFDTSNVLNMTCMFYAVEDLT